MKVTFGGPRVLVVRGSCGFEVVTLGGLAVDALQVQEGTVGGESGHGRREREELRSRVYKGADRSQSPKPLPKPCQK